MNFKPTVSLSYPENETEFSIGPTIIPGLKFNIDEKFCLDFCLPVDLAETFLTIHHTDNPTRLLEQRTTSTLSIFTFRRLNAQFGAGICL